jgi:hypothetical protein
MDRNDGSNLAMRDAGVQVRSPLRISDVRLRRRPLSHASEQLRVESAARQAPDISHLIGFGILLIAALLIAIGSMGGASPAADATTRAIAAVDSHGYRR